MMNGICLFMIRVAIYGIGNMPSAPDRVAHNSAQIALLYRPPGERAIFAQDSACFEIPAISWDSSGLYSSYLVAAILDLRSGRARI